MLENSTLSALIKNKDLLEKQGCEIVVKAENTENLPDLDPIYSVSILFSIDTQNWSPLIHLLNEKQINFQEATLGQRVSSFHEDIDPNFEPEELFRIQANRLLVYRGRLTQEEKLGLFLGYKKQIV